MSGRLELPGIALGGKMKKKFWVGLVLLLILSFIVTSTWAAVWTLNNAVGPLNGGALTYSLTSKGSHEAILTFDLLGYGTVDGNNRHADTFNLAINGVKVFAGGFNMGGGGDTFVTTSEEATILSTVSNGRHQGGLTQFRVVFPLLSGTNTIVFNYGPMQGLADEGWGLRNLAVTADTSPLPEPTTVFLLGIGVVVLGGCRVVRKKN